MLGRKDYTQAEFDQSKAAIGKELAAYQVLAKAAAADKNAKAALDAFAPLFFNSLTIALDRCFVHRVRAVSGKDGNPLNEVELLTESLLNNNGKMLGSTVIKLIPEQSITKLEVGDTINLDEEQFARLSAAFFDELLRRFL